MSEVGITAYGAYLPKRRLNRSAIADANEWMNPALRNQAKGTKAVCSWDEDSITMAVEAARDCLNGADRSTVTGVYLASTTMPFEDRHNAGLIAAALTLENDVASLDITATQRAGTSGLLNALRLNGGGDTLYLAADHRHTRPGSVQEMQAGDGAVALLLGTENIIARFLGGHSLAVDLVDHYRGAGSEFDYHLEERWVREMGYDTIVPETAEKALAAAGIAACDIDHFAMPATQRGLEARMAKKRSA